MYQDDEEGRVGNESFEYDFPLKSDSDSPVTIDSRPLSGMLDPGPGFSPDNVRRQQRIPFERQSSNETDDTPRFDNLGGGRLEDEEEKQEELGEPFSLDNLTPERRPPRTDLNIDMSAVKIGMDGRVREATISGSSRSEIHAHSVAEAAAPSEYRDEENEVASSNSSGSSVEPIVIWNVVLPMRLSRLIKKPPNLLRMAVCIVGAAPCFWCSRNSIQGGSVGTNRAVLTRLNILTIFVTLLQMVPSFWSAFVLLVLDKERGFLDEFAPHFWNHNGATWSVGLIAFILLVTCFSTIRVIQEVNLVGAIRYFWLITWLVPFEFFFTVSLFDRHLVTRVWLKHWWLEDQMSYVRKFSCDEDPEGLCKEDPVIREKAQDKAETFFLSFQTGLAISCCILLLLMYLMINSLEIIISKPIIQKSRETNVPSWLLLPTVLNALAGALFEFSPSSLLNTISGAGGEWIGIAYLVAAGLFLVALLMGWFLSNFSIQNSIDKNNKSLAVVVLIGVMVANTVILASIGVASILSSISLLTDPVSESVRARVACFVDKNVSCSNCPDEDDFKVDEDPFKEDPFNVCPDWTLDEVTKVLQTQLKQSATLAFIFILYAITVLRFGLGLRRHLALYQIDYV